jgi:hypothetical protein
MQAAVGLVEQARDLDVHELAANGEARPSRDLDATLRQVDARWFFADPHPGALTPKVLDEVFRATP